MRYWLVVFVAVLSFVAPARADLEPGLALFEQGNYSAAVAELLPAAEAGDARAQYVVGIVLGQGFAGVPDPQTGAAWLLRSAEQGYAPAQVELARMYRTGDGIAENHAEMVKWYRRAAEQGDVGAQLFVADAYAYGYGVEPDLIEAYVWYEIAIRYWGHLAERARDVVAVQMSDAEVAQARSRAAALLPLTPPE